MFRKAFYFFFFTAVLLAMSWHFLAAEAAKPILMRLFVIMLGASLLCLAQQGINEDQIRLGPGRPLLTRDRNPFNYWGVILLNYGLALLLLIVGIFVNP
jgi:hypothetical protein